MPMARVKLEHDAHRVYELDDGLLLVFKPAGHVEPEHAHPHARQLRVLRGRLRVQTASANLFLDPQSEQLSLAAGQTHTTEALEATWLIAEASDDGGRASM